MLFVRVARHLPLPAAVFPVSRYRCVNLYIVGPALNGSDILPTTFSAIFFVGTLTKTHRLAVNTIVSFFFFGDNVNIALRLRLFVSQLLHIYSYSNRFPN